MDFNTSSAQIGERAKICEGKSGKGGENHVNCYLLGLRDILVECGSCITRLNVKA